MDCIVHGVAKSETRLSALHTSLWSDVQFALELERGESTSLKTVFINIKTARTIQ